MRVRSYLFAAAVASIVVGACSSAASPSPSTAPASAAPASAAVVSPAASASASQTPFALQLTDGQAQGTVDTAKYTKPGPYQICLSNGFSGNVWRAMTVQSLKNEAEKQASLLKPLIILDGQGDVTKQLSDIESCIVQKADAILLIANSGTAVVPGVQKAIAAGIPVIPFNLAVDGNDWTSYIGTDACAKGQQMAKFLVDKLGGKGTVIALGGIPGNSYTAAAYGCAQKEFQATQIKVVYKDANWQEDKAKVVCTDLLTANPQIDGVWADGGMDTTGCLKAFVGAGRPLVPATGDDYNGLLKLYLANKAKYPNFDIYTLSEPTFESKMALDTALAILTGAPNVPHVFTVSMQPITGANADQWVKPNLPDGVGVQNDLTDAQLLEILAGQQ